MFHRSRSKNVNFLQLFHLVEKTYEKIPAVKKRREKRRIWSGFKTTAIVVLCLAVFLVILAGFSFWKLKIAAQEALSGKDEIEYAVLLFQEKKYAEAKAFSSLAADNFKAAQQKVSGFQNNFLLQTIKPLSDQLGNVSRLLDSAGILSGALSDISALTVDFEDIATGQVNFNALSREQKRDLLRYVYESSPKLEQIRGKFGVANSGLASVPESGLLLPFKSKLSKVKTQVEVVQKYLDQIAPLAKLAPTLFGYPGKSAFLVLLQNNAELRPTGGFIGTYGIFETDSGEIARADTHDVYHMDMPVQDKFKVEPPAPLKEYLGIKNWYLRDANWSPDWPTAAEQIKWFFKEEDGLLSGKDDINNFTGEFTGVIGVTPGLIEDLLDLFGGITVEGETYTSSNFADLLEYRVEKGYEQLGVSSWQRKEVIGMIVKELEKKITNLQPQEMLKAFDVVMNNLQKKNVIISLADSDMENIIKAQDWGGNITSTGGDYVMVVDANMAAYKTDSVMSRRIQYGLEQGANGVFADLRINYKHNGGFDWKTTRYRTYTRVYVPLNSVLVSSAGFTDNKVVSYVESGKTVFAGFISIEPGAIGNVEIKYKLPDYIAQNANRGEYELLFQKQPGNKVESLQVDLSFANGVKSYSPVGFYALSSENTLKWETDLETDRSFRAELDN